AAERRELDAWLLGFEEGWNEKRMSEWVRRLPRAGHPRRAALIEMVKADLRRRWQAGRQVGVERYLKAIPELGGADAVPVELLLAEYEVRQRFGAPCDPAAFGQRFPKASVAFRRRLAEVEGVTPPTRDGSSPPVTTRDTPRSSRSRWVAA